ncbi:2-oxoglutarate dehydrogenase complex dihydrolipoyllysine-residue succinyltransferase [Wolbachia endosymbiont of Cruorifilaria tuberocauda]|uniref:2-oxoglutarate dehydrogenase complex dihydrolipoyllysine-residue succinyltransferase n=1 Tax=Wolbachia endosymbiont of Cruorifilaria tuberocauda TaxID=1812111 RepID=UPI00158A5021|nr:2-oxoglutarate dehydrogenase complex dihydrolipoyllysine-residue succinyltransferase [Wolbachia endosymbiont of Cruorifilaria tuberocauda]QKX01552.1 2-oxoglutarate dehydrogenase complex dihydrolipoyllysine-residue succinyltransferase [Wolbachia endosymbiont of Cruorifilaria tuberocauda]
MGKIIEIRAPETLGGESIMEGIVKIKRGIGEIVKADDLIFEVETDKAVLELTAEASGEIAELFVEEDDVINPGQLLAKLLVMELREDKSEVTAKKDAPSARKIMEENAISVGSVKGTGMGGRITKADVKHMSKIERPAIYELSKSAVSGEKREERVKISKIRQVIAARLKASQNTAAILTTFNEIDMQNVVNLRIKYKEAFEKKHRIRLGFMSFFIKAAVQALKEIPEINAEISGDEIIYKHYYDIGVAVGTDKGLVVPVIRSADQMSFAEIELTLADLSKKAHTGKLQVSEMEGATFTISNGGVYGSLFSTPIINPPQSGILGMHSIQNRPVAIENSIEIRPTMYIALSYDHRIIDGRGAVTFLVKIKNYIEDTNRLILEI